MDLNKIPEDEPFWRGPLLRDGKLICDVQCYKTPISLPQILVVDRYDIADIYPLSALPTFVLHPVTVGPTSGFILEWNKFLTYLFQRRKVAIIDILGWELFINPPPKASDYCKHHVFVSYRQKHTLMPSHYDRLHGSIECGIGKIHIDASEQQQKSKGLETKRHQLVVVQDPAKAVQPKSVHPTFAQTHPSYLETLGQSHASWIFGALAELIDNSRDAKATRVDISIDLEFFKGEGTRMPVLCVTDDGCGMTHEDIVRMVSFGHKRPEEDNKDVIGRFGVGFKTGAMRLGKDVVVLTQSEETRSIAFLSRSYNEGNDEVEIPIISYRKHGEWMEFDLNMHSEAEAEARLKAVKEHSFLNEYSIGQKFASFGEDGTGTQVYIYNLDKWGSDYTLQWDPKFIRESGHKLIKSDIMIRSRRLRSRPGQMSKEVPLDYSLHAYLEVMFLEPRMKIYVQGTQVKTRPLRRSLNKTRLYKGNLLEKNVELTLGRSREERDRGNCGIFLYWHGRLIEAYKRVGGMVHTADMGRGVIGVIDVTEIMRLKNGNVGVLNNKQGFLDCEEYAILDEWLGSKANSYWDENFDSLEVSQKNENAAYTPDHLWVQCNKCLKWRVLPKGASTEDLPDEWFCFMPPFRGACSIPEEECEAGVVTLGANRTAGVKYMLPSHAVKDELEVSTTAGNSTVSNRESSEGSAESDDNIKLAELKQANLKRLKRGPAAVYSKGGKKGHSPPVKKAKRSTY